MEALGLSKKQKHPISMYEPINKVGRGKFGSVFIVRHKETKCIYALKSVDVAYLIRDAPDCALKRKRLRNLMAEKNVMSIVDHPFVAGLKEAFITEKRAFIVMEYLREGTSTTSFKESIGRRSQCVAFTLLNCAAGSGICTAAESCIAISSPRTSSYAPWDT